MDQRMIRKERRQRAWVRLMVRKRIPAFRSRAHLWALQRWAAFMRWRAARAQAAEVQRLRERVKLQRIDPNAPCPSCGARDGKIVFSQAHGKVLHRCNVDGAIWGEAPIVSWADWKVEIADQQLPEPMQLIEAWQARQRMTAPGITPSSPAKGPM